MRPLLPGSALVLLALTSCVPESSPGPGPLAPAPSPDVPDAWLSAVTRAVRADARAIRDRGGVFVATLPTVGLEGRFDADGIEVVDDDGEAVLGLSLVAWGRDGARVEALPVEPDLGACGPDTDPGGRCIPQLEYARDGLTEWWRGQDAGVEQGWTVAAAPPGEGGLSFVVAVDGALSVDDGGPVLGLTDASGRAWTIDGISAWDARGDAIPATARFIGDELVVEVDDAGAIYPITVDPVYSTVSWRAGGGRAGFGSDVKGVGDVDGDGYDDVVVGARSVGGYRGAVYVFLGSPAGIASSADTTLYGEATTNYFGESLAALGDVDADGYADFAVGASGYSSYAGRVYVYMGSASGISSTPAATITGPAPSSTYGSGFAASIAGAGDVDGDGYTELLVSAYQDDEAYLYPGSAAGIATTATLTLTGPTAGSDFGYAMAGVGDPNGDGYDDIVVTAYRYSSDMGAAYLYPGSATGLATSPTTTMTGTAANDEFGYSVAGGGDLNGDGYDDVVVGAIYYGTGTGMVSVYDGSASGISATASSMLVGVAHNYFGSSVAIIGDVTGDGYDDLAVGGYAYSSYAGMAAVYPGTSRGVDSVAMATYVGDSSWSQMGALSRAGDVNGDGYPDLIVGSPDIYTYGDAYVFHGSATGLPATASTAVASPTIDSDVPAAAGAGDVNGDGYDDIVVGNGTYDTDYGILYVYFGSVSGPSTEADQEIVGANNSYLGEVLAPAGDTNGDGYDDLLAGAPSYSTDDGRVYLYRGSATGLGSTVTSTISGSSNAQMGYSIVSAGDLNADGKDDVLLAAPSTSSSGGGVYLYRGGTSGLGSSSSATFSASSSYDFGERVAVGDFDADGHPDLAVGDPDYSTRTGRVSVFYGSGTTISTSVGRSLTGETTNNYFGSGLAAADIDGDGDDDLIVGAYGYSSNTGKAYVYLGSSSRIAATADTTIASPRTTGYFGAAVAAIGDVDGDGYADIAFGDETYDSSNGRVYVYNGSASGLTAGTTVDADPGDAFGSWVGAAGDVNADGFDDLLVAGDWFVTLYRGYDSDADLDGSATVNDCDDADPSIYPGAIEVCDGVDQDCDGVADDGVLETLYADADGDGYGDAAVSTTGCATSVAGYVADATDCDDTSAAVSPADIESCNGVDDDCDGTVDEDGASGSTAWYTDADADGYGGTTSVMACAAPSGSVATSTDCDDTRSSVNPGAIESCDGRDDDCDGSTDESGSTGETMWYPDADADGSGSTSGGVSACTAPSGYLATSTDCDDGDAAIHVGVAETCDSADNDCDGATDEGVTTTYYLDADADGYGNTVYTTAACSAPAGYVANATDCDDGAATVSPGAAETCDHVDDDCDGAVDEGVLTTFYADADADGYGDVSSTTADCSAPAGYVALATDCSDADATIHPGAGEACDAADNDCDGAVDEGALTTYYLDADADGYGDVTSTTSACSTPAGYADLGTDCDDAAADVHPDAAEVCDDRDQDCDGAIDEGAIPDWHRDADADGFGDPGDVVSDCAQPEGYVDNDGDCDDADAAIGEGVAVWRDADGDGFGDPAQPDHACGEAPGYVSDDTDCDDASADVHPGADETWYDGIDQDCDANDDDQDGDGATVADDCDDTDPARTTGCNGDSGSGPDDTGTPEAPPGDEDGGCGGCDSGRAGPQGLAFLFGALVAVRRRRQGRSS